MRLCVERAEWTLQCLNYWLFNVSDADSGQDVSEFNWDDYLEETGALSVPHHAFKHVSKPGQPVFVLHHYSESPENTFFFFF